jgi:hypothetical protein
MSSGWEGVAMERGKAKREERRDEQEEEKGEMGFS